MPIGKELIEVSKLPWFPNVMKELGYEPVRHGHWVHNKWSNMRHDYNCSLCGCRISGVDPFSLSATAYYYCPECGAKMDEVTNDE